MDDYSNAIDSNKFRDIWRRVMPEATDNIAGTENIDQLNKPHIPKDVAAQLCDFMDDEQCDAQLYCHLAAHCPGAARQTLMGISADERCHLKRLRAHYYILTGELYTPPCSCPLVITFPETLRQKYADELKGAAAYRAASCAARDPNLAKTYLDLSEDEARHSKLLACLIAGLL